MVFAGVPAPGPERPILEQTFRLSPSQADAYINCPRQYALERRLRLSDSSSPYAALGTLVHSALEAAERDVVGSGKTHADLEDAMRHLERVWAGTDFGTPQLDQAWLAHARDTVLRLYGAWPSDGMPIELEKKVQSEIGGVEWVGFIDRLKRVRTGCGSSITRPRRAPRASPRRSSRSNSASMRLAVANETGEPVAAAEMWFPRKEAKSVTSGHSTWISFPRSWRQWRK